MENQKVEISRIVVKEGVQQRHQPLNEEVVKEYLDKINAGAQFPPLVVFDDGQGLTLADGRHRYEAFLLANVDTVDVEIIEGTVRDAILYAVGANADHGLRRTNADKRMAVQTLLQDQEWSTWSDGEIARRARVSQAFVSSVRRELSQNGFEFPSERIGRNGRRIDTTNIGSRGTASGSDQDESDEGSLIDDEQGAGNLEDGDSHNSDDSTESSIDGDQRAIESAESDGDSPPVSESNDSVEEQPTDHVVSDDKSEQEPAELADEVSEEDDDTEEEPLIDDVEALKSRILELEKALKQKDEELRLKDMRIAELEKQVAELRDDVQYYEDEIKDSLKDSLGEGSGSSYRDGYQPIMH